MGFDHDRTVHAKWADQRVVRYDRAGKWWLECEPARLRPARRLSLKDAALLAVTFQRNGGEVFLGKPGGGAFDRAFLREIR